MGQGTESGVCVSAANRHHTTTITQQQQVCCCCCGPCLRSHSGWAQQSELLCARFNVRVSTQCWLMTLIAHCRKEAARGTDIYLEVSPLVQGVGRPEQSHLPDEHVLVIDELHPKAFHRVLRQAFVLEGQSPDRAGAWSCSHTLALLLFSPKLDRRSIITIWFATN